MAASKMSKQAFLAAKGDMLNQLSAAIYHTLTAMGEEVHGVYWFSSASDEEPCEIQKAA